MNLEDEPLATSESAATPEHDPSTSSSAGGVGEWEHCAPQVDHLIIQDDEPVENFFYEVLMRLLVNCLKASWAGPGEGRPFGVFANVGLFPEAKQTPLVPDVMVSLDVDAGKVFARGIYSYFLWEFGKPPNVVIEFVSDRRGGEATHKMRRYAQIGVCYYVIFDPFNRLKQGVLRAYELKGGVYEPIDPSWLPNVGLGLTLWEGEYEGYRNTWLRWCDRDGAILLDGAERAEQERLRAEQERQRAEAASRQAEEQKRRAEEERQRAERLAAQLRAMGIDPDA
jgi:Uma2 family endonuclease